MTERPWRAWLAASLLSLGTTTQAGAINLDTGQAGWTVSFVTPVGAETAAAMNYSCAGAGAPLCMSITSNGFADGTWINNASPSSFNGEWTARISFDLPVGATGAHLDYEFLGVDDYVEVYSDAADNSGLWQLVAAANINQVPTGTTALGASGGQRYGLEMRVRNNMFDPYGLPMPISVFDGTAVVAGLRVVFDQGGTVPEPGTWALCLPALLALGALRGRAAGSRP